MTSYPCRIFWSMRNVLVFVLVIWIEVRGIVHRDVTLEVSVVMGVHGEGRQMQCLVVQVAILALTLS